MTSLLAKPDHLESLKVVQLSAFGTSLSVFGKGAVVELLLDFGSLPLAGQSAVADSAREVGENNRGEGEVGESGRVPWNGFGGVFRRAVDENLEIVSNRLGLHAHCEGL